MMMVFLRHVCLHLTPVSFILLLWSLSLNSQRLNWSLPVVITAPHIEKTMAHAPVPPFVSAHVVAAHVASIYAWPRSKRLDAVSMGLCDVFHRLSERPVASFMLSKMGPWV